MVISPSSTDASAKDELSALDLVLLISENLRTLVVIPVSVGIAAYALSFLLPATYTATTRLIPPQQSQSAAAALLTSQLGALAGVAGASLGPKSPADTYVAILKSRTVADRLAERFKLKEVYDKILLEDVRKKLESNTRAMATKDGLIVVEVDDGNAQRAADLANAYVTELRELTQTIAITDAGQRRLFFQDQLERTKENLAKAEVALRGSGISDAIIKTVPQSAVEAIARLKAQIAAHEVRLAALRGYMTESNPEYRQTMQELVALRAQLSKAAEVDSGSIAGAGTEYVARFREFKYQEVLFDLMAKQYEMARLDEARQGAILQVVDVAIPSERKSKPNATLMSLVAFLIALIGSILTVLVRQVLKQATRDPSASAKLARLASLFHLKRKA